MVEFNKVSKTNPNNVPFLTPDFNKAEESVEPKFFQKRTTSNEADVLFEGISSTASKPTKKEVTTDEFGNRIVKEGAITTAFDEFDNQIYKIIDKGNGLQDKIEYNYDDNSVLKFTVSNFADGSKKIELPNGSYSLYKSDGSMGESCTVMDDKKTVFTYKGKDGVEINEFSANGEKLLTKILDIQGNIVSIKNEIADSIAHDVSEKKLGIIPTTGKNLKSNIYKINKENVGYVLQVYEEKYDETLYNAVIKEIGLPQKERMEYLGHIKKCIMENHNEKYTSDLSKAFDKEIISQMKKIGFANADYLPSIINRLNERETPDEGLTPNGNTDENFAQGKTGDCWLLASIKAVSQTPKGAKLLNNSIKIQSDGNIIVTLKGVGKSYLITSDEINGNTEFSSGDGDVRALEIAVDKYFMENRGGNGKDDMNGNYDDFAFMLLTGKKAEWTIVNEDYTDEMIDNYNRENHVATVSAFESKEADENSKENDDEELVRGHAYTVKGSDKDNVYLINPWDTSKVITVPREKFKEFFDYTCEFDL